jgi:hypothetical protein
MVYDADNQLVLAAKNSDIAYQKGMENSDRNVSGYNDNLNRVRQKLEEI